MVGTGALMVPGDVLEWSCAIVVPEIPVPSADPFLLREHKRMPPPAENSQRQLLQHLGCDIREFCRVWPRLNQVSESLVADYADYVASPPFRIKALGADGKISVPNKGTKRLANTSKTALPFHGTGSNLGPNLVRRVSTKWWTPEVSSLERTHRPDHPDPLSPFFVVSSWETLFLAI